MYLIFDTETTGLPQDYNAPITNSKNWPRMVQLAWQLHDQTGKLVEVKNFIVKPDRYTIPFNATKIHGISTERANQQGVTLSFVLDEFNKALEKSSFSVGHNIGFDINIVGAEIHRLQRETAAFMDRSSLDTCTEKTATLCQLSGGRGGKFKLPNLTELHKHLFQEGFDQAHNASADVEATTRCFLELVRTDFFSIQELNSTTKLQQQFKQQNPNTIELIGLNIEPYSPIKENEEQQTQQEVIVAQNKVDLSTATFCHLHCHTQYSILQSTLTVEDLIVKAKENGMPAVAITDKGNMYAAYQFLDQAKKENIKGILGCEFNVCKDHTNKNVKDNGAEVVFLAKNKKGYHNLAKLSSISHIDGFYYVPRIDLYLVEKYKGDIMVLTGGVTGIIPNLILNVGDKQAEESFVWWHQQFGDDFYAELIDHDLEENKVVNEVLLHFAKKYNVKVVATNNVFYGNKEDADAQDILLCVRDGEKKSTPIGRGREYRFGFPNDNFYFKSQQEMKSLFAYIPEAIENVQEIVDKCEPYTLKQSVLLPKFDIPKEFIDPKDDEDDGNRGENIYLRHITYQGAKNRYKEITDQIKERLDFELSTIEMTGYPGYFLIVQDFTSQAKKMGVLVGPGRGSAAGSAVAYCIGITNIDPIKYNLLFERFLNPDRVSLPDIDIDFDNEGRGKIIDWVVQKYGSDKVAQIITYGTMAAKSSIKDVGRVLDLPLSKTNDIAKLVPDTPGFNLNKYFALGEYELREKLREKSDNFFKLKALSKNEKQLDGKVIKRALTLEGVVRNTGVHACGVIITPEDMTNYVPVAKSKDSQMVTQFDNNVVENAGLLKMDFLGLKTLTLIKDAVEIIKDRTGKEIILDDIPLDDEKTYKLFQQGETIGIFQYESPGMQKYLQDLKPTVFADLIAMNALYRPGPMEYIPSFIKRKHGKEEITYDLHDMEEYLKETYGITVYQEQVMLLSQKLAGFTKGEADGLRKAMGKKIFTLLEELKPKFLKGCEERGHDIKICEKIWKDWEAFASYAFNKSHSTCYADVAYRTAYLKAHYPAEYMASVLSNNMNNLEKLTFFMQECKRMGISVLGPDVNESRYKFSVNKEGSIRVGMGGIKGVGAGAVLSIVKNRQDGNYKSIFDTLVRVDPKSFNKSTFCNLIYAGAFDSVGEHHRAQLFYKADENDSFFAIKLFDLAKKYQEQLNSNQMSIFGELDEVEAIDLTFPKCEPWSKIKKLSLEKEVVGIFISGHPLDDFKLEMEHFCKTTIADVKKMENSVQNYIDKKIKIGGVVTECKHLTTKNGKGWGILSIQDYTDTYEIRMFGDDYLKYRMYFIQNNFLQITANFQQKKWFDGSIKTEFKVTQVQQLQDVFDKLKEITIDINVEDINEELIKELDFLTNDKKAEGIVVYNLVYEQENMIKVSMISESRKVPLNKGFIEKVEDLKKQKKLNYHLI